MTACSIQQSIETSQISHKNELCIVENTKVRNGFLDTVTSVLHENNIKYRIVNEQSVPKECVWTATYTATWRWDMALYMSYANIKIFQQGQLDGEALYDATRGGANMGKFIDAEVKIRELVNQLILFKAASLFRPPATLG